MVVINNVNLRENHHSQQQQMLDLIFHIQGHAAPILYAVWAEAGLFPVQDLAKLRTIDSDLEGHPTPVSSILL